MFKKILVAGLALGAGWFILNSTHLGGYVRTAWNKAKVASKNVVPLEFQIETLRNELNGLDPEIKTYISKLAEETVNVQNLRETIQHAQVKLETNKRNIRTMADELKNADVRPASIGGLRSADRLKERLEIAVATSRRFEEEVKSKVALLDAKERGLENARNQLESMRNQRELLEVQIAQLEADLKTMRLKQTESKFSLDDTKLSSIKAQLSEIQNQIKVEQTKDILATEMGYGNKPAVEKKGMTRDQLIKEVEAYLGGEQDDAVAGNK